MVRINNQRLREAAAIAAMAAAYYLSGRLGLLLAVPPGYATAVWPPSGIALAGVMVYGLRLCPGVWLGSFAINVGTGLDTSGAAAALNSMLIPAIIALGATAQTAAGAWLVRRFVGYRNILTQELDIVRILLLGGPLACLINSSIGVGTLWLRGAIAADAVLFNWWTWWVGDSIGVLVFAPVVLVWAVSSDRAWLRQKLSVVLPLLLVFGLVVAAFVVTSSREQARVQTDFENTGNGVAQRLRAEVDRSSVALSAVAGLFGGTREVRPEEFDRMAERMLAQLPGLDSITWDLMLADAERSAFEAAMRARGQVDFRITELDANKQRVPARHRESYVIVAMGRQKDHGLDPSIGLDLMSEPVRREVLERAQRSSGPAASGRIELVGPALQAEGFLIVQAVYDRAAPQQARGYAVVRVRTRDIMAAALDDVLLNGIKVRLLDRSAPAAREVLYGDDADPQSGHSGGSLSHVVPLDLAQRDWELEFTLPAAYLVAHRSWGAWLVLAGGLLLTALLGILQLVVVGRAAKVHELVDQRTAELAAAYQDLEAFSYSVAHDLRAPLRAIDGFSRILLREHAQEFSGNANEFLHRVRAGTQQMGQMIDDLLSFSRLSRQPIKKQNVESAALVRRCLDELRDGPEQQAVEFSIGDLPPCEADPSLIKQVWINLLSNALKYTRKCEIARIEISCTRNADELVYHVKDNGVGFDMRYADKLFGVFQRLHRAEDYEGTGVGLAIVQRIIRRHGGRVWVEAQPDQGAMFYFTLPAGSP